MTWEQEWMRRIIKTIVWCIAFYSIAWLLSVTVTMPIIGLVVASMLVGTILDSIPTLSTDRRSKS